MIVAMFVGHRGTGNTACVVQGRAPRQPRLATGTGNPIFLTLFLILIILILMVLVLMILILYLILLMMTMMLLLLPHPPADPGRQVPYPMAVECSCPLRLLLLWLLLRCWRLRRVVCRNALGDGSSSRSRGSSRRRMEAHAPPLAAAGIARPPAAVPAAAAALVIVVVVVQYRHHIMWTWIYHRQQRVVKVLHGPARLGEQRREGAVVAAAAAAVAVAAVAAVGVVACRGAHRRMLVLMTGQACAPATADCSAALPCQFMLECLHSSRTGAITHARATAAAPRGGGAVAGHGTRRGRDVSNMYMGGELKFWGETKQGQPVNFAGRPRRSAGVAGVYILNTCRPFPKKKKLRPETYESKGYAGHRRSSDGGPPTPVRGHQVASEHHCGTSEKGGWAKLGK